MKWHQIGNGRDQLRLTVAIFDKICFLCEAYMKQDEKHDKRQIARFKAYIQLIREDRVTIRGRLT